MKEISSDLRKPEISFPLLHCGLSLCIFLSLFHNTGQQHLHTGVSTLDRLRLSCAAVILVHKSPLWDCAIVAAPWSCLSCKHSNPAYASTWISIRLLILLAKYMLALNTFLMIWYSNANRDCS